MTFVYDETLNCLKSHKNKRIKINNKVKSIFVVPEKKLINFKEALIFGFLGLMRLLNKKNVLKSVTGSKKSTSSGIVINNKIF